MGQNEHLVGQNEHLVGQNEHLVGQNEHLVGQNERHEPHLNQTRNQVLRKNKVLVQLVQLMF
jgi:hypothetical protein